MKPPRAPQFPVVTVRHGQERVDEFAWMADRDDPRLTAYLQAENAYADHRTAHLQALRTEIFEEIRSRTVETDLSVPVRYRGWWYYSRTVEGRGYAVHARLPVALSPHRPTLVAGEPPEGEQVLLDENVEAVGSDFFALGDLELSPDGRLLAFSADRSGQERYDLVIRELQTGAEVDAAIQGIGQVGLRSSTRLDQRHACGGVRHEHAEQAVSLVGHEGCSLACEVGDQPVPATYPQFDTAHQPTVTSVTRPSTTVALRRSGR